MVALRSTRLAQFAPFGLATVCFVLGATEVGPQDLSGLVVRHAKTPERWGHQPAVSPFGVQAAAFSLARPISSLIPAPETVRPARHGPDAETARASRASKGDLLIPRIQLDITAELLREDTGGPATDPDDLDQALRYKAFAEYDISLSLELDPQLARELAESAAAETSDENAAAEGDAPFGVARLYFDAAPMNIALPAIERWETGEAPVVIAPAVVRQAAATAEDAPRAKDGPASAAKDAAPREAPSAASPSALLRLTGKARTKAEKCLANAVYFEARSEPVRGQVAVAQVVLNRVFSEYYPGDVCNVVYQNASRYLSCQFTFACDGIPDVVTEPFHWQRAMRIAKATLDGKVWLNDVGKATHYHASYVYPYWVRSMRRHKKIGLHTFYRPRAWGDGSDEPSWSAGASAELVAKL